LSSRFFFETSTDLVTRNHPVVIERLVRVFRGDGSTAKEGSRGRTGWIEGDGEQETARHRETERDGRGCTERERERETGGARSIPTANPVVTHKLPYSYRCVSIVVIVACDLRTLSRK